jgi:FG-GAP-like repeat/IPT/TIG domain/Secretion system C-terminal sorting domain
MKNQLLLIGFVFFFSKIQAQSPSISSFSPVSGPIGTQVTITGTNFSTTPGNNSVYFGAVKATVTAATGSSLTVSVPLGANFQPVSVAVNNLIGYSKAPFIITYPGGGINFSASSFATAFPYTGGGFVTEGDMDGDGKVDVIFSTFFNGYITVGRNTSSGAALTFSSTIIGGMQNPISVKTADVNGDGRLDMVVADYTSNVIRVLKNNSIPGSISFAPDVSFSTGSEPRKFTLADIDNDGKTDIIVANQADNNISVFRNTSTATIISFAARVNFATAASPEGVCTGDMDNDGKTDIMVACNNAAGVVSVFKNTSVAGTITLNAKTDYGSGAYTWDVAAADMDGDGKLDLVSTNSGPNNVSVFRNTSTAGISFAAKVDFSTTSSPRGIAINDLDADGKPDIVTANWFSSSEACVLKNTSISGALSFNTYVPFATQTGAGSAAVADFNGDGLADIITANSTSGTITYLKNQLPILTGIPVCTALLTPANNTINVSYGIPLQFKWRRDANATGYKLKITPQSGAFTEITTTDSSYIFTPVAGTNYTWTVTPLNMLNPAAVCNAFVFSTCAAVANTVTISAVGATDKCGIDSVLLRASPLGNTQWFLNGLPIAGAAADTLWAKLAGNYTVRTAAGTCYADPSNIITINNLATPLKPSLNVAGATIICEGGSVTLTSSLANTNNQWFKNGIAVSGSTGDSYAANTSGAFFVRVINTNNGCNNYSDTVNVVVNAIPATPAITLVPDKTIFCDNETIKLSSSAAAGNQWYRDNVLIPGATGIEHITARTGNYTVKVTQNNCASPSSPGKNITVYPVPFPPGITRIAGTSTFCAGDSVTFSSTTPTGNQWFKNDIAIAGATGQVYKAKETGAYSVKATENGCQSPSFGAANVTANALPAKPLINAVTNSLSTGSGYGSYKWYLNNVLIAGANTNQYDVLQSSIYKVEVTDNSGTGCTNISDNFNFVFTSVNDITVEGNAVQVYPNPVIDDIIVKVSGTTSSLRNLSVSVMDINGKILQTVNLKTGNNAISMKQYAAGVYTLIVKKGNTNKTIKVLKKR